MHDWVWVTLVLVAAALHATWNALVKSGSNPTIAFAFMIGTGGVLGLLAAPLTGTPPAGAWPYLALSTIIHSGYYALLLAAYARGDLSHVYPIARGLGPVLAASVSGLVAGEALSTIEWLGVGLVTAGLSLLAFPALPVASGNKPQASHATLFAAATGVLIASYTVVDALGSRAGGGLPYIAWLQITSSAPFVVWAVLRRGPELRAAPVSLRVRGLVGGVLGTIAYAIALLAMRVGKVVHVASLRETSVLFAAFLGAWLLRERVGPRRFGAAALVASGLVVMRACT